MVRPHRCRRVNLKPNVTYFKPRGIPLVQLEEVILQIDTNRLNNIRNSRSEYKNHNIMR